MQRLAVPLLLLLAVALAGCGGATNDSAGDFEGEQRAVAEAIEDLEEAAQEDEARRICQALLAREVVTRIEDSGQKCETAVDEALDNADSYTLTVESVRIDGKKATARVETGTQEEKIEEIELVREDDAWRVSGLPGAS